MIHTYRRIKHRLWWLLTPPIVFGVATTWMVIQSVNVRDKVDRVTDARRVLTSTMSGITDAETGQRGYLLTGDPSYLTSWQQSIRELGPKLNQLVANAEPGYMDVQTLMHFRDLAQRKIQELTSTVDLYRSGDHEAALAVVRSGEGKREMDDLRRDIAAIEKNLDTAMAPVRAQVFRYRNIFFGLGLATLIFTIIGLSSLFFLVRRYGEFRDQYDERLQAANRDLENKVKERTEELALANRDLSEFARVAAHDLKAPIRTSAALLELFHLRHAVAVPPEGTDLLDRAQRSLRSLQDLLASLLTYYRVGGAALEPMKPVPLTDAVGTAISNLRQSIESCCGEVAVSSLPVVSGYAPLLTLVFQNLIENSLKYRKDGEAPRIAVESSQCADGTVVSVSDNGIGFDPQYKVSIFRPFSRLHQQTQYQGAGIGLATCARIIERHGGEIWADSASGVGSTFYLRLPVITTQTAEKTVSDGAPQPDRSSAATTA